MGCDIHMWLIGKNKNSYGYTEITLKDENGEYVDFPYFRHYYTFGTLCNGVRSSGVLGTNNNPERGKFPYIVDLYKDKEPPSKDEFFTGRQTLFDYVHDTYEVDGVKCEQYFHSHTWITVKELEKMVKRLKKLKYKKNISDDYKDIHSTYNCVKLVLDYAKNVLWLRNNQSWNDIFDVKDSVVLIAFDS